MKVFPKRECVAWLKRQPERTFYSYYNHGPDGCLFTRIARSKLGNSQLLCKVAGNVIDESKKASTVVARFPFHDTFWNMIAPKVSPSQLNLNLGVSREVAIILLSPPKSKTK